MHSNFDANPRIVKLGLYIAYAPRQIKNDQLGSHDFRRFFRLILNRFPSNFAKAIFDPNPDSL